jgi:hypothetical protein
MKSNRIGTLIASGALLGAFVFAPQSHAGSIYVSLNVEIDTSEELYYDLRETGFFERNSNMPDHISVVDMKVNDRDASKVASFIDTQLKTHLTRYKKKSDPYFYVDQISVIPSPFNENVAQVVLENSDLPNQLEKEKSSKNNSKFQYRNDSLAACLKAYPQEQQSFVNFTKDLASLLRGQSADQFTSVTYKNAVGVRELSPTFPHVTIGKVDYLSANRGEAFWTEQVNNFTKNRRDDTCANFVRFRIKSYFIKTKTLDGENKRLVKVDDLGV